MSTYFICPKVKESQNLVTDYLNHSYEKGGSFGGIDYREQPLNIFDRYKIKRGDAIILIDIHDITPIKEEVKHLIEVGCNVISMSREIVPEESKIFGKGITYIQKTIV